MYGSRKLDGEDPDTIFMLRCVYFSIQALTLVLLGYMYLKATELAARKDSSKIVYIPAAATPFQDPNAPKKKFTQTTYGPHVIQAARGLISSTVMGIVITSGLHIYRGVVIGLAMQSVMGPLNLLENPLFKLIFLKSENPFESKTENELDDDVEVVDDKGEPVILKKSLKAGKKAIPAVEPAPKEEKKSFEDILLDTWDDGEKADLSEIMAAVTKDNVNYQVEAEEFKGWTALMIISGLGHGVKGVTSAMKQLKVLGADPKMIDNEGWNALHWTTFHGNAEAAKVLVSELNKGGFDGVNLGLHLVADNDGKTALVHGKDEGNNDVVDVIMAVLGDEDKNNSKDSAEDADEGLRKRK